MSNVRIVFAVAVVSLANILSMAENCGGSGAGAVGD
jgi:hypothetical protein